MCFKNNKKYLCFNDTNRNKLNLFLFNFFYELVKGFINCRIILLFFPKHNKKIFFCEF